MIWLIHHTLYTMLWVVGNLYVIFHHDVTWHHAFVLCSRLSILLDYDVYHMLMFSISCARFYARLHDIIGNINYVNNLTIYIYISVSYTLLTLPTTSLFFFFFFIFFFFWPCLWFFFISRFCVFIMFMFSSCFRFSFLCIFRKRVGRVAKSKTADNTTVKHASSRLLSEVSDFPCASKTVLKPTRMHTPL